jgi:FKBP-type peptidyl-prolyl cis-trans isomerase
MTRLVRTKDLTEGTGPAASKGDRVVVDLEIYLPRGDKVYSAGGTREIRVPPHLAYGDKGSATIPPKAALRLVVKMLRVGKQTTPRS